MLATPDAGVGPLRLITTHGGESEGDGCVAASVPVSPVGVEQLAPRLRA